MAHNNGVDAYEEVSEGALQRLVASYPGGVTRTAHGISEPPTVEWRAAALGGRLLAKQFSSGKCVVLQGALRRG